MTDTENEVLSHETETEIVLGEETENVDEEKTSDVKITKKAVSPRLDPSKRSVKDLTQEEKEIIIANAKKGIENEFFDVKFFKNGNARVIAKKSKTPTVSQKVIKNNNDGKVYLSNDQLLMEHIIELNSRLDKLTGKHKKLKKKYRSLKNDIYIDSEEIPTVEQTKNEEQNEEQEQKEVIFSSEAQVSEPQEQIYNVPVQRGWRARVQYL
ncbi:uncharacterized protein GO595_008442 [Histomonas meleagridis]|uniref:uncharacterized protein n=1 Tax=Histomonas meleagridis TaxID=135588 RepID=UPI003559C1DC|nr:hypothetical protein GO595_008442 [Histomonas meleagridis]